LWRRSNTLKYQPEKIAAIEGHWENKPGEATPLVLIGWPDMQAEKTRFSVEIPYLGSLILTHSLDKQVPALKEFAKEDRPNSTVVFWTFRVMVGLGMLMILTGLLAFVLRLRGKLFEWRPFLHLAVWMGPAGIIAILAGWYTTEVGRQPWIIHGLMRTADASSGHSFAQMSLTLGLFVLVYFAVFGVGIGYMLRLVRKGPVAHAGTQTMDGGPGQQRTPARPLSAPGEGLEDGHSDSLDEGK
jgi:cytochrome d ubiquinol oxidase subunit I